MRFSLSDTFNVNYFLYPSVLWSVKKFWVSYRFNYSYQCILVITLPFTDRDIMTEVNALSAQDKCCRWIRQIFAEVRESCGARTWCGSRICVISIIVWAVIEVENRSVSFNLIYSLRAEPSLMLLWPLVSFNNEVRLSAIVHLLLMIELLYYKVGT